MKLSIGGRYVPRAVPRVRYIEIFPEDSEIRDRLVGIVYYFHPEKYMASVDNLVIFYCENGKDHEGDYETPWDLVEEYTGPEVNFYTGEPLTKEENKKKRRSRWRLSRK